MSQSGVLRFLTVAFGLTWAAACGSGSGSGSGTSKAAPVEPTPLAAAVSADAPPDAPEPPKLVCDADTTPVPGPAPEPTWYCTRADGTRHGPFLALFPDGGIEVTGTYKDGALEGPWARHHPVTRAVIERGAYAAGQKQGTWTQLDAAGKVLGTYELVAGTGVEKRWYEDGPLYSETALKAGVLDGTSKIYARDGFVLESARYRNGKLDGPHAFGTKQSMRFEETFSGGVRRGERKIWHQGKLIADERYDRYGRLDGPYVSWRSPKIKRIEGEYAAGKRTGLWTWNDRDGKKEREGNYVRGKRDGDWLEWADDKLVWSGQYAAGKPDGTFVYFKKDGSELGRFEIKGGTGWMLTFHGNGKPWTKQKLWKGVEGGAYQELTRAGKLVVEGHYAGGVKHGAWKEWTHDGVLLLEQQWNRGKLDGVVRKYVDGKLSMETTYVAGKAEGAYTEYRQGKPAVSGQFAADLRVGTWTHHAADGAVVRIATYKDGVLEGPYRELADGVVLEGTMVAGRRSGTWTRTDRAGTVVRLTYRSP